MDEKTQECKSKTSEHRQRKTKTHESADLEVDVRGAEDGTEFDDLELEPTGIDSDTESGAENGVDGDVIEADAEADEAESEVRG